MSLIDYQSLPHAPQQPARDHLAASALDFTRDQRDALIGWVVELLAPVVRAETDAERATDLHWSKPMGRREYLVLNDELRTAVRKFAAGIGDDTDLWERRIAFARGERDLP